MGAYQQVGEQMIWPINTLSFWLGAMFGSLVGVLIMAMLQIVREPIDERKD